MSRLFTQHRAVVVFSLSMVLAACSEAPAPEAAAVTPAALPEVVVTELAHQPWQGTIITFGVIEALEEVTVAAELSGTVSAVHVDEGDRVQAGQLLLELDPAKRELALQRSEQEVQRAGAALKETRLRLQRRKDLADRKSVSREVLDSAQLSVDQASANYQQAISARDLAARELEDTRIYSPTPGLVDVQALQAGEPVQAGVSLFTLQADQGLRMHTWVSEADIGYIQAGAAATVSASGLPGRDFEATIEWVGANADPATGNFPVKLILGGATDGLRPGMTAKAALVGVTLRQALLLPEAALVDRNRRRVVFVLEQGTVHQREPLLGAGFNDRLLVVEGLSAGEQVVIRGHSGLLEGTAVSVRVQD